MASRIAPVADKLSKIRDFLWQEARRHPRKFLKGPRRVPNGLALARAMQVNQSTVSRILALQRNLRADRPEVPDFRVSPELEAGLMLLCGITSLGELWDAIENAPPAPLPHELDPRHSS
jgi:hypothetical protein